MKDKIKRFTSTKQFHICMVLFIILLIILATITIALRYNQQGEKILPFELTKITIISTSEGTDNEDTENRWNLNIEQNNDIYLYIEKNSDYKEVDGIEAIDTITLKNFNIIENTKIGEVALFKPNVTESAALFKNIEENKTEEITFTGEIKSDMKNMQISNQGGLMVFRYSILNLGQYISNEIEEINHTELLKNANINNEDLKFEVNFDIYIKLKSGKVYGSNITLHLPSGNVVEEGTQSEEYTELDNIIFKRINGY